MRTYRITRKVLVTFETELQAKDVADAEKQSVMLKGEAWSTVDEEIQDEDVKEVP